jgi:hypothetical protein
METTHNEPAVPAGEPEVPLTLAQVEERLHQLVRKGHADSYEIGRLYNYVVDRNLALTGGFKDAPDFFKQRITELSQSTLTVCGAVAGKFSEAVCLKYGMDKLYTLLTYARRAGLQVDGAEPGPTPIDVPREDGKVAPKAFSECTREELRWAVKHLRSPMEPVTELEAARIKRYQEHLDRGLPAKHGIRVAARREDGVLRLTLRNIPEDWMERLVEMLSSAPPRPAEAPAPRREAPVPLQLAPPPPQPMRGTGSGLRDLFRQAFQRPTGS